MSIRQTKNPTNCPKVIVKAYGGEPIGMFVVGAIGERLRVARAQGGESIPMPAASVRRFEEGLYAQLADAYAKDDKPLLAQLWAQTEPFSAVGIDADQAALS